MKNFLLSSLLIFLLGNLCTVGAPWWSIAPIAALVLWTLPNSNGGSAFLSGLLAGMLLWGVHAYFLDSANNSVFSAKIGQIFQGASSSKIFWLTTAMGGILSAFGALTGQWAREIGKKQRQKDYYKKRKKSGKYF